MSAGAPDRSPGPEPAGPTAATAPGDKSLKYYFNIKSHDFITESGVTPTLNKREHNVETYILW